MELSAPYELGVDISQEESLEVWDGLVAKGREFLTETAFVQGGQINDSDINALKTYYQFVFDDQEKRFGPTGAVFNASLREHLLLAERVAMVMAPKLGFDTNTLRALVLIHDFGRMFSHRRGRNDRIEMALFKKIEFDEKLVRQLPSDSIWMMSDEETATQAMQVITTENDGIGAAVMLADVLAKWSGKDKTRLRRWEEIIPTTRNRQKPPDKGSMWPSEFTRQSKVVEAIEKDLYGLNYTTAKNWFEKKSNTTLDEVAQEVEDSLRERSLPHSWSQKTSHLHT